MRAQLSTDVAAMQPRLGDVQGPSAAARCLQLQPEHLAAERLHLCNMLQVQGWRMHCETVAAIALQQRLNVVHSMVGC